MKPDVDLLVAPSRIRHPELDGLRGSAILLVVVFHYSRFIRPGPIADHFIAYANIAWSGVDLFFVLSGFLIGGILIDYRDAQNLISVFYIRRALRIFPLYFLVLSSYVLCIALPVDVPYLFTGSVPLWSYVTFLQNFAMSWYGSGAAYLGPTWSLAVEEQFYLLFPLVVFYIAPRKLPYVLMAAIVVAISLRVALFHYFSMDNFLAFYVLMPCRADALSIGVLCAIVYRSPHLSGLVARNIKCLRLAVAGLLLCFVFAIDPIFSSKIMIFGGYTLLSLLYGTVLLISILGPDGLIRRVTNVAWLRSLGKIAFGVYLIHLAIVGFVAAALTGDAPRLNTVSDVLISVLSLTITVFVARASWEYFERHFVKFGGRFEFSTSPVLSPEREAV